LCGVPAGLALHTRHNVFELKVRIIAQTGRLSRLEHSQQHKNKGEEGGWNKVHCQSLKQFLTQNQLGLQDS
jgi:hypothetical protein